MNGSIPCPRDPLGRAVLGTVESIPGIAGRLSRRDLIDLGDALSLALESVSDEYARRMKQDFAQPHNDGDAA